MKSFINKMREGIISENPVLALLLGICPLLAASTRLSDAVVMGMCAIVTTLFSALVIRFVKKKLPEKIKLLVCILFAVFIISIFELLLRAFLLPVSERIGMYLPLLSVTGIIFAKSIRFERVKKTSDALISALACGVGFFAVIFFMALVREVIGNGTFFGLRIFPEEYGMLVLTHPSGGLILLGVVIAVFRHFFGNPDKKEGAK
ncbi:MAG: hypothetical protein IKU65_01545 [Oscillospiraceae bacterium]|nr:hypothetical protein [Oscillospiraceae bacterium]